MFLPRPPAGYDRMLETMAIDGPFSDVLRDRARGTALAVFIEPEGRGHGLLGTERSHRNVVHPELHSRLSSESEVEERITS
jgi:hypothetical protein